NWLAKTTVGLGDLSVNIRIEGQTGVNITEIRMIEEVVSLPSELETKLLAQAYVFEQRQVRGNDSRTAESISGGVADVSSLQRTRKAGGIDKYRGSISSL